MKSEQPTDQMHEPLEGSAVRKESGSQSLPNSRPTSRPGSRRNSETGTSHALQLSVDLPEGNYPGTLPVLLESPKGNLADGLAQDQTGAAAEHKGESNVGFKQLDEHDEETMKEILSDGEGEKEILSDDLEIDAISAPDDDSFRVNAQQNAGDPELIHRLADLIQMQHAKKSDRDLLVETLKEKQKQVSESVETLSQNVHSHRLIVAHVLQDVKHEIIGQASKEVTRVVEEQMQNLMMRGSPEPSRPDTRCSEACSEEGQDLDIKMVI